MAIRYNPCQSGVFDPEKCVAAVSGKSRWPSVSQCSRRAVVGEWCRQHSPEAEKAREKAADDRWKAQKAKEKRIRIRCGLAEATVKELKAELKRRRTQVEG